MNNTKNNDNNISTIKLVFIILFSVILGGVIMICLLRLTSMFDGLIGTTPGTVITKNETQVYEKSSLAASVDKVYQAVVTIECYRGGEKVSTGSGFVYKVDNKYGYILTNQHVVSESTSAKVIFNDTTEAVESEILGGDEYLDLAVVRIDKSNVKSVVEIGSSEKIKLGDSIYTIGAPMGVDYKGSVTSGILSGKDRMVATNVSGSVSNDWIMRVLQIDAPINPGNSGGPLLNINGQVIGICSMKLVNAEIEGMGFAIPIEYAMNHIKSLENGKKIEWPVLGISMINVTDSVSLYRNGITISSKIKEGVVIANVSKGTAADKSGLQKGDVIIKIDNNKTTDTAYLRYQLYQHAAGETMKTTIIRNGKEIVIDVKL